MKALLYEAFGGPEVLQLTSVPDPEPGARDVVVAVAATALNHLDVVQRNGWYHVAGLRAAAHRRDGRRRHGRRRRQRIGPRH